MVDVAQLLNFQIMLNCVLFQINARSAKISSLPIDQRPKAGIGCLESHLLAHLRFHANAAVGQMLQQAYI